MLGFLRRAGLRRGLLGGSRTWMVIGAAAWSIRLLSWAWRRSEKVVFLEELQVGESFLITQKPAERGRRSKRS